jgi:hypothetical protein
MDAISRIQTLNSKVDENTRLTNSVKSDTASIVVWTEAAKFGGGAFKWLAIVGSALITAWAAFLTVIHFKP